MTSPVYCARYPLSITKIYEGRLRPTTPFIDRPLAGQKHFFRGMRNPGEIDRLLNERYSIGPHDEMMWLCGGFGEVFGFWFVPLQHQFMDDNDDQFWPNAEVLTPDHIDMWSKARLIDRFHLEPEGAGWRDYFGAGWNEAYNVLNNDPMAKTVLSVQKRLLEANSYIGQITCVRYKEDYMVDDSIIFEPYLFFPITDRLCHEGLDEGIAHICSQICTPAFVSTLKDLTGILRRRTGGDASYAYSASGELLTDLIMTAFLPVPAGGCIPRINTENFDSLYSMILGLNLEIDEEMATAMIRGRALTTALENIYPNFSASEDGDVYRFER